MKIKHGYLWDNDIELEGWIIQTLFKIVFFPSDSECGFDYQWLHREDKNKLWKIGL